MVRKRGKGRAVKRARQKFGAHYEDEDLKLAPHSMVIPRGEVEKDVRVLVQDFRRVMEPFTASELKATKKNSLKDFISIAGPLHVTHLLMFSQSKLNDHLKIVRLPRGPTLHFNIIEYSLRNDVLSILKRKQTHQKQYLHQPLLILNGFNTTKSSTDAETQNGVKTDFHLKLLTATLQNMFPSINVTKVNLNDIRRCILFNYNKNDNTIDFRQYNIKLKPVGLSKPVKKLVQEQLPDLSNFQDISEFIEKGGNLSESEAEFDGPDNQVEVKEEIKNKKLRTTTKTSATNAIRLSEIGPRLKLKLIKIEEGVCDGQILFHDLVNGSEEEINAIREQRKQKKQEEKSKRNKKSTNKRVVKKETKNISKEDENEESDKEEAFDETNNQNLNEDIEYYKQELGEEPNSDFIKGFKKGIKRKRKIKMASQISSHLLENSNENMDTKKGINGDDDDESHISKKMVKFEDTSSTVKKQAKAKFFRFSNKKKQTIKSS